MAGVASAARAEVAFADYPLAPEHPFPAAVDFARDAYVSLLDRFAANRIAIAGESAGGGGRGVAATSSGRGSPAAGCRCCQLAVGGPGVHRGIHGYQGIRDPMLSRAGLLAAATEYLAGKAARCTRTRRRSTATSPACRRCSCRSAPRRSFTTTPSPWPPGPAHG
ncbi:alpha/beta hydrolase fold domain-containing protein [Kutzneria kofuensis]|uniref:alpha/beta hydrolase fold domain-containing protein n=1 Tax=Kutzneria kofuensis TaxID=103725 RepID=UPI003CD0799D